MAQITLDLERGGPALAERRQRRPRNDIKDGDKAEDDDRGAGGKRGLVWQRARGCTYMVEPHVAQGESWQVHLYGEAARVCSLRDLFELLGKGSQAGAPKWWSYQWRGCCRRGLGITFVTRAGGCTYMVEPLQC